MAFHYVTTSFQRRIIILTQYSFLSRQSVIWASKRTRVPVPEPDIWIGLGQGELWCRGPKRQQLWGRARFLKTSRGCHTCNRTNIQRSSFQQFVIFKCLLWRSDREALHFVVWQLCMVVRNVACLSRRRRHCWTLNAPPYCANIHCLVSVNVQQASMNVTGSNLFRLEELNYTPLLHKHFHVRRHFVRLPLCCHLSHGNKI